MNAPILVINAGSSSIKFSGYESAGKADPVGLFKGQIEGIGSARSGSHKLWLPWALLRILSSGLKERAPRIAAGRVVVAHLGAGASMCAMLEGKSVDTTMGFTAFRDAQAWAHMAILNVAASGRYSSDRTIAEYVAEIRRTEPCPVGFERPARS